MILYYIYFILYFLNFSPFSTQDFLHSFKTLISIFFDMYTHTHLHIHFLDYFISYFSFFIFCTFTYHTLLTYFLQFKSPHTKNIPHKHPTHIHTHIHSHFKLYFFLISSTHSHYPLPTKFHLYKSLVSIYFIFSTINPHFQFLPSINP